MKLKKLLKTSLENVNLKNVTVNMTMHHVSMVSTVVVESVNLKRKVAVMMKINSFALKLSKMVLETTMNYVSQKKKQIVAMKVDYGVMLENNAMMTKKHLMTTVVKRKMFVNMKTAIEALLDVLL